jgi:hypothetical protein
MLEALTVTNVSCSSEVPKRIQKQSERPPTRFDIHIRFAILSGRTFSSSLSQSLTSAFVIHRFTFLAFLVYLNVISSPTVALHCFGLDSPMVYDYFVGLLLMPPLLLYCIWRTL